MYWPYHTEPFYSIQNHYIAWHPCGLNANPAETSSATTFSPSTMWSSPHWQQARSWECSWVGVGHRLNHGEMNFYRCTPLYLPFLPKTRRVLANCPTWPPDLQTDGSGAAWWENDFGTRIHGLGCLLMRMMIRMLMLISKWSPAPDSWSGMCQSSVPFIRPMGCDQSLAFRSWKRRFLVCFYQTYF